MPVSKDLPELCYSILRDKGRAVGIDSVAIAEPLGVSYATTLCYKDKDADSDIPELNKKCELNVGDMALSFWHTDPAAYICVFSFDRMFVNHEAFEKLDAQEVAENVFAFRLHQKSPGTAKSKLIRMLRSIWRSPLDTTVLEVRHAVCEFSELTTTRLEDFLRDEGIDLRLEINDL